MSEQIHNPLSFPSTSYLRAFLSLLFSSLVFFLPNSMMYAFTLIVGGFLVADGVLAFFQKNLRIGAASRRWWPVSGATGIFAGTIIFLNPAATTTILSLLMGIWALSCGISHLALGSAYGRGKQRGKGLPGALLLSGWLSLGLSGLIFLHPFIGLGTILNLVGLNAAVVGFTSLGLGLSLSLHSRMMPPKIDTMNKEIQKAA